LVTELLKQLYYKTVVVRCNDTDDPHNQLYINFIVMFPGILTVI